MGTAFVYFPRLIGKPKSLDTQLLTLLRKTSQDTPDPLPQAGRDSELPTAQSRFFPGSPLPTQPCSLPLCRLGDWGEGGKRSAAVGHKPSSPRASVNLDNGPRARRSFPNLECSSEGDLELCLKAEGRMPLTDPESQCCGPQPSAGHMLWSRDLTSPAIQLGLSSLPQAALYHSL